MTKVSISRVTVSLAVALVVACAAPPAALAEGGSGGLGEVGGEAPLQASTIAAGYDEGALDEQALDEGTSEAQVLETQALETQTLETQAGYTGKYYTQYAVLKPDGYLYRADADGNPDNSNASIWGESATDASETLDKVEVLYIDPDVTSLDSVNHHYYISSKSLKESDRSMNLSGRSLQVNLEGLQKIVFKLDESGKNACTTLPTGVFREHALLTEVSNFDKTQVTDIPDNAFYKCEQLASIALPDTVRSIGDYAFRDCARMGSAKLGSGLVSIGNSAFTNCSLLGVEGFVLELPVPLMNIGSNAFYGCQELREVVVWNPDTTVTAGDRYIFAKTALEKVYVHNRFLGNYQANNSTNNWRDYRDKIHGFLEIESVANATYTGSPLKPAVNVTWMGDDLTSVNYKLSYSNNVNAGTATVEATGIGFYAQKVDERVCSDTRTFTISQAAQKVTVANKAKSVSKAKLEKKAAKVKPLAVSGAKGAVTFAKSSGAKALSVNAKSGVVKVKKGAAAKTYKMKVKVTASETKNYKAFTKTVKVTVTVS